MEISSNFLNKNLIYYRIVRISIATGKILNWFAVILLLIGLMRKFIGKQLRDILYFCRKGISNVNSRKFSVFSKRDSATG